MSSNNPIKILALITIIILFAGCEGTQETLSYAEKCQIEKNIRIQECRECLQHANSIEDFIALRNRFFCYHPSGTLTENECPIAATQKKWEEEQPEPYKTFPKETLYQIEKNPQKHLGELYAFHGTVIQAEENSDGIIFQMLVDDEYDLWDVGSSSLIVIFPHTNNAVAKEHEVDVLGFIGIPASGQNIFGATVSSLTFSAIAVQDRTVGRIYWLTKDDDTIQKWKSGKLFPDKN